MNEERVVVAASDRFVLLIVLIHKCPGKLVLQCGNHLATLTLNEF